MVRVNLNGFKILFSNELSVSLIANVRGMVLWSYGVTVK